MKKKVKKKDAILKLDGTEIALRMGLSTGVLKGYILYILDVENSDETIADGFMCYLETVNFDGEIIADSFETLCAMGDLTPMNLERLKNALVNTEQDQDIIDLVGKILELQKEFAD